MNYLGISVISAYYWIDIESNCQVLDNTQPYGGWLKNFKILPSPTLNWINSPVIFCPSPQNNTHKRPNHRFESDSEDEVPAKLTKTLPPVPTIKGFGLILSGLFCTRLEISVVLTCWTPVQEVSQEEALCAGDLKMWFVWWSTFHFPKAS